MVKLGKQIFFFLIQNSRLVHLTCTMPDHSRSTVVACLEYVVPQQNP
jgi:hypothetical protein